MKKIREILRQGAQSLILMKGGNIYLKSEIENGKN